mgnify:CR=1 FL=1
MTPAVTRAAGGRPPAVGWPGRSVAAVHRAPSHPIALALAVGVGFLSAVQSRINGELAVRLAAASELSWTVGFVEWTPQEDLYAALGRADTLMFERKPKRG